MSECGIDSGVLYLRYGRKTLPQYRLRRERETTDEKEQRLLARQREYVYEAETSYFNRSTKRTNFAAKKTINMSGHFFAPLYNNRSIYSNRTIIPDKTVSRVFALLTIIL